MWNKVEVRLTGVAPLMVHNGQLANPLNPGVKAIKKISGKRAKTDADYEELGRLEFQGSLYINGAGVPVIPSRLLEATVINGAKKSKDGMKAKAGMFIDDTPEIEYDGPKDRDELWADNNFRDVRPAVVSRARIMRTRPIFPEWALAFNINYDDQQVDMAQVVKWVEDAGTQVGLAELRPRYGRFEVKVLSNGKK